ncbi:MAG: exo-alpha-sialidase [Promethearchaeota archaeon]|nr:MAG: exo-alpha-sialidase [Candidatus Lokiarchaeota archaeon]
MVIVDRVKIYSLILVGIFAINNLVQLVPAFSRKFAMKGPLSKGKSVYLFVRSIILIIDTGIYLYFAVWIIIGFVDGYPWFLVLLVGTVFLGIVVIFIIDIIQDILHLKKKKVRQSHVLFAAFVLLLLISTFGFSYVLYKPQWNTSVDHQPIFTKGEAGREYRIPSMLVLPGDIILAFAESRTQAYMDWGDIDLVMKRSTDGGITWSEINVLGDNGTRTVGNPCPVWNNDTSTIHMIYNLDNKLVFEIHSTDLGITWSNPRHLTDEIGLDITWNSNRFDYQHGTGPGIGIQMSNGTLVIPSYYFGEKGSHVIYSSDNGTTWDKGADLGVGGECQVIELLNGSLYINARNAGGRGRYIATSSNGGVTWNPWIEDSELPDLGCMASVIRYSHSGPYQNALLFTNPYSSTRTNLTLQISIDDGVNWNIETVLFEGSSAYCQLGELSDGTVCFLAEAGPKDYRDSIQFCTYTLP